MRLRNRERGREGKLVQNRGELATGELEGGNGSTGKTHPGGEQKKVVKVGA